MKKLIIIATVLLFVISANAQIMYWGDGYKYTPKSGDSARFSASFYFDCPEGAFSDTVLVDFTQYSAIGAPAVKIYAIPCMKLPGSTGKKAGNYVHQLTTKDSIGLATTTLTTESKWYEFAATMPAGDSLDNVGAGFTTNTYTMKKLPDAWQININAQATNYSDCVYYIKMKSFKTHRWSEN